MAEQEKLVKFTCKCPNIWTSKGKLLRGESDELPPDEVKQLNKAQDAIIERIMGEK